MPPDNYGSSRRQKGSTAKTKIHHAEASAGRAQPEGEGNTAGAKTIRRTATAASNATPSNLFQWKPQCACSATYRKSGPVQSLGNNLGSARTEDEIPELFIPFGRPRPVVAYFSFPFAFSPFAIVSA
jgi:hypothetical protein